MSDNISISDAYAEFAHVNKETLPNRGDWITGKNDYRYLDANTIEAKLSSYSQNTGYLLWFDEKFLTAFKKCSWHVSIPSKTSVYAQAAGTHGKRFHRLVCPPPKDNITNLTPDHIDGSVIEGTRILDNRASNLRLATKSIQNLNQGLSIVNKTGIKGVTERPERCAWVVEIKHAGDRRVKTFRYAPRTIYTREQAREQAIKQRQEWEIEILGEVLKTRQRVDYRTSQSQQAPQLQQRTNTTTTATTTTTIIESFAQQNKKQKTEEKEDEESGKLDDDDCIIIQE
jgi:hypothetical protein